jgi:mannose-6-phosphate isomerase-like protein (cupin superfamily)
MCAAGRLARLLAVHYQEAAMSNSSRSMAIGGYAAKAIDEMEAIHGGAVKLAAAELGIESFGLQVLDFPPGFEHYPEHDHSADGQEEVYVVLRGSAEFEIEGERVPIDAGRIVRISPVSRRKLYPGENGVRVLAIGCAPGGAYERPDDFQLGARS